MADRKLFGEQRDAVQPNDLSGIFEMQRRCHYCRAWAETTSPIGAPRAFFERKKAYLPSACADSRICTMAYSRRNHPL